MLNICLKSTKFRTSWDASMRQNTESVNSSLIKLLQIKAITSVIGGEVSVKVPFKIMRPHIQIEHNIQQMDTKPQGMRQVSKNVFLFDFYSSLNFVTMSLFALFIFF